jgi:hypothetical protein
MAEVMWRHFQKAALFSIWGAGFSVVVSHGEEELVISSVNARG